MKVWVTKYALSKGITEYECRPKSTDSTRVYPVEFSWTGFTIGRDAHTTKKEALQEAEKMRVKKILSLRRQIEKLEKLKF